MEKNFSIDELESAIKKSKLDKAPGPDGYTNEFFKTFKDELIVWLHQAYSESFKKGE